MLDKCPPSYILLRAPPLLLLPVFWSGGAFFSRLSGRGQVLPTPPRRYWLSRLSLASPCYALLLSRVEEKVKDCRQELEEVGGSNYEAMTHLNSAPEDLFADV